MPKSKELTSKEVAQFLLKAFDELKTNNQSLKSNDRKAQEAKRQALLSPSNKKTFEKLFSDLGVEVIEANKKSAYEIAAKYFIELSELDAKTLPTKLDAKTVIHEKIIKIAQRFVEEVGKKGVKINLKQEAVKAEAQSTASRYPVEYEPLAKVEIDEEFAAFIDKIIKTKIQFDADATWVNAHRPNCLKVLEAFKASCLKAAAEDSQTKAQITYAFTHSNKIVLVDQKHSKAAELAGYASSGYVGSYNNLYFLCDFEHGLFNDHTPTIHEATHFLEGVNRYFLNQKSLKECWTSLDRLQEKALSCLVNPTKENCEMAVQFAKYYRDRKYEAVKPDAIGGRQILDNGIWVEEVITGQFSIQKIIGVNGKDGKMIPLNDEISQALFSMAQHIFHNIAEVELMEQSVSSMPACLQHDWDCWQNVLLYMMDNSAYLDSAAPKPVIRVLCPEIKKHQLTAVERLAVEAVLQIPIVSRSAEKATRQTREGINGLPTLQVVPSFNPNPKPDVQKVGKQTGQERDDL